MKGCEGTDPANRGCEQICFKMSKYSRAPWSDDKQW